MQLSIIKWALRVIERCSKNHCTMDYFTVILVHVCELLNTVFMLFTAKAEIKDFKQTPSQNSKVLMQCIVGGIPSPEVTWYLQNTKLPYKQTFPDYDVTANKELLIPQASLVSNSFLCNCTNPLDSVARFARSKFFKAIGTTVN